MQHTITWFEIPAVDFDRAVAFYSTMLDVEINKSAFGGEPHGFLPSAPGVVSGAVVLRNNFKPASDGALIYLNVAEHMTATIQRVEQAGGTVLTPETSIDPQGSFALILDSEGNRIGLHSPPAR
ncbi:MAG: VOC family protein [Chloroflexi bacterium]|nr:VOC family protein [Chloroflexota bacterium]